MDDFGLLVGRHYTSLPSLSDTQLSELMLDASGRLIISGRYLEDSAHSSGDAGIFTLAVRNDSDSSLVSADGDYAPIQVDATGKLKVAADVTSNTEYAEDSAHTTGDIGQFTLAVRHDANTSLVSADGDYAPLQVDATGRLKVIADVSVEPSDAEYAEDSAHTTGDVGLFTLAVRQDTLAASTSADGDYSAFKVDADGELYVTDEAARASLSAIETDAAAIEAELLDQGTTLDAIETEQADQGTTLDSILTDTNAMVVDLAAIEAELLDQGTTLDSIETEQADQGTTLDSILTDTNAMVVDLAAIEAELLDQGTTLDSIETEQADQGTTLDSIETEIQSITHAEDAAHVSGDSGVMSLAVRADSDGSLAGTDGDYAPLQVDSNGKLKVAADIAATGDEQYVVTDALAAAGDGIATITAAATPWITVASYSHTSGTAYVYGWQWACDQNAQARIVTDDTSDVIVYKTDINSSAQPGESEHFSEGGRIEIAGAASLEIQVQIKKRSSTGGDANGTGSMHIRAV